MCATEWKARTGFTTYSPWSYHNANAETLRWNIPFKKFAVLRNKIKCDDLELKREVLWCERGFALQHTSANVLSVEKCKLRYTVCSFVSLFIRKTSTTEGQSCDVEAVFSYKRRETTPTLSNPWDISSVSMHPSQSLDVKDPAATPRCE